MVTPIEDLLERQALYSNSLATVMPDCVAIRDHLCRSYLIVDIARLIHVKRIYVTRPGFLVISAAFSLLAAATFYSRDGGNATIPLALLSAAFTVAYFFSRRASVVLTSDLGTIETMYGSPSQATEIFSAVGAVRFGQSGDALIPQPQLCNAD